jgi:hypothetical protein
LLLAVFVLAGVSFVFVFFSLGFFAFAVVSTSSSGGGGGGCILEGARSPSSARGASGFVTKPELLPGFSSISSSMTSFRRLRLLAANGDEGGVPLDTSHGMDEEGSATGGNVEKPSIGSDLR